MLTKHMNTYISILVLTKHLSLHDAEGCKYKFKTNLRLKVITKST